MAGRAKALRVLLLGIPLIFLQGNLSLILHKPILTQVPLQEMQYPAAAKETPALSPKALEGRTLFHPIAEEYLRQDAKEVPYQTQDLSSENNKVFEYLSPLELALLPTGAVPPKRKENRPCLLEAMNEGDWAPLSRQEWEKKEEALKRMAIEMGTELTESLSMPYVSNGIQWTTDRLHTYQRYLTEQYRLHVKLSGRDASLYYDLKY